MSEFFDDHHRAVQDRFETCSHYVPRPACETPLAQWKRIDALQDVLPPRDQGKAENAGGVITNEDYAAKVMAGEG
ncbi:MAG: hypothetical protein ACREYE_24660 [Gammaproteobacteria bacterium]